jgi:sensor histidine kinase regulating citrate/malate metabolism
MSDTEPILPARNPDLEWQVVALQRQVFLLLLALVVISATIVFYLLCESRFMGTDLSQFQPQAMQVIRTFDQHAQAIQNFNTQLNNYALTHQNFQPVLMKYGWTPNATAPAK